MENKSQIIIYTTEKGETKLEVRFENEGHYFDFIKLIRITKR